MTYEQKLKLAEMKAVADRELSDIPVGARDLLLPAIEETPSARSYLVGAEGMPPRADLVRELWDTDKGRTLRDVLAQSADADGATQRQKEQAQLDAINELPRAQRMAAARAAGIKT